MADRELLNAISEMMDEKLSGIKEDVRILKEEVSELKEDVRILKEEVSELKEDVRILKEDVEILKSQVSELRVDVNMLKDDNGNIWTEIISMKGQITELLGKQIEMKTFIEMIDTNVRGIRTHLENETDRNLKLLAESILPATSNYIASTREISNFREEIDVLNRVVKNHAGRIQKVENKLQMA